MKRWFCYFSYKGTAYHGWQRQPNGVSVQQVMEDAFSLILNQPITLTAAGRTDAGVHAELMVAHFDTEAIDNAEMSKAVGRLNNYLPKDIAIKKIVEVQADAHARFDAIERTYEYRCVLHKDAFAEDRWVRIPPDIDFEKMNDAAQLLLETKDFASFCKVHTDVKTTYCDVRKAEWRVVGEGRYVFEISADRFLRNMVRAVVGTLLEVGKGRMNKDEFRSAIEAKHRTAAGQSAPAHGLYLTEIVYPDKCFTANMAANCL